MKKRQRSRRLRAFVAVLCTFALVAMPVMPAWGDVSSGEMKAYNQTFDPANVTPNSGASQRIVSFGLGDSNKDSAEYSYESLGTDSGKQTLTLSSSALQKAVKEKLLPQWAPVAASVFRDQAGQLVDLYGKNNDGGNMSQSGFDHYFNMGSGGSSTEYANEKWSCYNLSTKLGQTYATHVGDPGWDQFTVSGVKQVSSLSSARNLMGQALRDCEKTNAISAQEFLNVDEGGNTRLDELKSDTQTTGFVNIVTAVNCKGSSADFDYVTFGIVFYDFEPVPVAAQGLKYVTGGYGAVTQTKAGQPSEVKNRQQQDIVHSALLGDSVTETATTTLSGLASFKLSENVGANVGMSTTESSTESSFGPNEDGDAIEGSESTSAETFSMGLNWGAAWEMAGALGAEQGHSKSVQTSKAVETTITIPPHTATTIDHSSSVTTFTQTYQQPAILNYKVAIFAMSGDFYSSSAFGGIGRISAGSYDKQSLVIKFDTKDESMPFYGCTATDDLYSRAITNIDSVNYDVSGNRTYSTHSTASGWKESKDINWAGVISNAQDYYRADVVNGVAKKNFFYETPGKLNAEKDKASSTAQTIYPLYDLDHVSTPKTHYALNTNYTLDSTALAVQGYDRENVPFYGFDPNWGAWNRCNENGIIINNGQLLETDPVSYNGDKLVPKSGTLGGTIYLKWVAGSTVKPKTDEHLDGQDLTNPQIASPVVTIDVINSALNNPKVTAEGSYVGYYGKSINLNDVMTYEVTDNTDKIVEMQANWESREPASRGINVNEATGVVTFTKPGTYNVRPYIVNNNNEKVFSNWLTVTATEHNVLPQAAQDPTCTEDGWIAHYRCADCGKYYSDVAGQNEITVEDVTIKATGHDWGEWATITEASDTESGKQQRVCKNDASHVEERNLYTVQFNMHDHGSATPEKQVVAHGEFATAPQTPAAEGYTFDGWFTDADYSNPFDFGTTITGNLTLHAKWTPITYTIATTAVVVTPGNDGEQNISPTTLCSVGVGDDAQTYDDADGYKYYYKEVEYGTTITLTATPGTNYGLKEIQAMSVSSINPETSEISTGGTIGLTQSDSAVNTYSFTMPAADVAVVGNFDLEKVTVTYDPQKPEGVTADVQGLPDPSQVTIDYAKTPSLPTLALEGYTFGGWFKDSKCTKPYLTTSAITEDTTLYAKWTKISLYDVTYTLLYEPDPSVSGDTGSYSESYKVESGTQDYDPTNDLYNVAGKDMTAAYELQKDATSGSCWYKDKACTEPYIFGKQITDNLNLYAKVVPKKYTVTYYNDSSDEKPLGTQSVDYGASIGEIDSTIKPAKENCRFTGWQSNGAEWKIKETPVTGNLNLYASFIDQYTVAFDANGHGTAPDAQTVDSGGKATEPQAPTADGYTFGGWYTDAACSDDKAYNFDTSVTEPLTLYAKWTAGKHTVTFDANGHGTAPAAQTVDYNSNAAKPADPTADGYTFGGWYKEAACTTAYDFAAPVTGDLKLYAKWTEAVVPVPDPVSEGVEMYRLYNPNSGEHFYTGNAGERDAVVAAGWSYEGVGWTAPTTSNTPVYRLYNANGGEHHYTMSEVERDMLVGVGWSYEDIGWYSDDEQRVPLYRDYNPYAFANNHNYTTSAAEHDMLMGVGWRPEGYAWYAIK